MNPFQCFMRKIEAGLVDRELGQTLADTIEEAEKEYLRRGNLPKTRRERGLACQPSNPPQASQA